MLAAVVIIPAIVILKAPTSQWINNLVPDYIKDDWWLFGILFVIAFFI